MCVRRIPLLLLLAATSLTFACAAPASPPTVSLPPPALTDSTAPPVLLEPRLLTLVTPSLVRRGDDVVIRLIFAPDLNAGFDPAAPFADVFSSHGVIATARLELPGLAVRPPGLLSQPLTAGQSVTFTWHLQPQETGEANGTVWFFLRFIPTKSDPETIAQAGGLEAELPVAVLPVRFEVVSVLGLSGGGARLLGGMGMFFGFLLILPALLERWGGRKS